MRTIEDIKREYEKTKENDEMVQKSERVYGYKNEEKRTKLREEYIKLLPKNQRLAIFLHSKLCHSNHADMCSFYYGVRDLQDDWNEFAHKEYLKKSNRALEVIDNEETIMRIVEAVTKF